MDTQLRKRMLEIPVFAAINREGPRRHKTNKDLEPAFGCLEPAFNGALKRPEEAKTPIVRLTKFESGIRKSYRIAPLSLTLVEKLKERRKESMAVYTFIVKEDNNP